MDKKLEFLERVTAICYEYGLCIVSGDPYEGVDVSDFDFDNRSMYADLFMYLSNKNG